MSVVVTPDTFVISQRPSVPITQFEQAAIKYLFADSFDSGFDLSEAASLLSLFGAAVINMIAVWVNIFFLPSFSYKFLLYMGYIIFYSELVIVNVAFLLTIINLIIVLVRKTFLPDYCVEIFFLSKFVGKYSSLRLLYVFSPEYVGSHILYQYKIGIFRGIGACLVWAAVAFVSVCAAVIKTSQVSTVLIMDFVVWNFFDWARVIGFILNLSKIDSSEDREVNTLLDCVHRQFVALGDVVSVNVSDDPWSMRIRKWLGYNTFETEIFEVVTGKLNQFDNIHRTTFNFIAFIGRISTTQLRRYLQMTQSMHPYYCEMRQAPFKLSAEARDPESVKECMRSCDPETKIIKKKVSGVKNPFDFTVHCE